MAATLDSVLDEIASIQSDARAGGAQPQRPRWPMIVLQTPRGGPDRRRSTACRRRARFAHTRSRWPRCGPIPSTSRSSSRGCAPTRPEELFDESGQVLAEVTALAPEGERRMSANPHTNGGLLTRAARTARLPRLRRRRARAGANDERGNPRAGHLASRRRQRQPRSLQDHGPRRDRVQPPDRRVRRDRPRVGRRADPRGRPSGARRTRDGGAVRASLPGLARGLRADRSPRPVQLLRGVHPHHRLDVQPARQVAEGHPRRSRGGGRSRR